MRAQSLSEAHAYKYGNYSHVAGQAVVLFPAARDAEAFFAAAVQRWPACSNRQFTVRDSEGPGIVLEVGNVSNTNGVLSGTWKQISPEPSIHGWACQRALAVANNVVIDVKACSGKPGEDATYIAHAIHAKVPT